MNSAPIPVGIDLGTTFSAVAHVNADGATEMIPNDTGGVLTPSVVLFEDDAIHVGATALKARLTSPDRIAENVKRDIGQPHYRDLILGQQYPPEVIQSCILQKLRDDIVRTTGTAFQVVVTVPAYFDEARRKVTADAAAMSGLPVLDILNEPTAAALAFGERLGYLDAEGKAKETLHLVVYDLGGGTFDVTVIELSVGQVRTLATDGDYELGGVLWDERLAQHAKEEFARRWPDAPPLTDEASRRLMAEAHVAKHQLSTTPLAALRISHAGHELTLGVRREEFENMTLDLVERTLFTTNQALKAANVLWSNVDRLLLVGGSTRMPMIHAALKGISGITPDVAVHPDEAVARGAAIFARNLMLKQGLLTDAPKLKIIDVSSHGLGIEGINMSTRRAENITLIPRNTPLPHRITRTFVTKAHNQRSIKVELLEGESTLPSQCSRLAVAAIRHLPPNLPEGTPIEVTYTLQANGRLDVKAEVAGVGDAARLELERVRGLDEQKVNAWKTVLQRHGGYRDFEEALVSSILSDEVAPQQAKPKEEDEGGQAADHGGKGRKSTLEPAIHKGAALAASDKLKEQKRSHPPHSPHATPRSEPLFQEIPAAEPAATLATSGRGPARSAGHWYVQPLIHVLAGVVGLALGYYALCYVRPDLNFLNLSLPGLSNAPDNGEGGS